MMLRGVGGSNIDNLLFRNVIKYTLLTNYYLTPSCPIKYYLIVDKIEYTLL